MVVLALMAMATAVVIPRIAGQMDQVVDHSVFFDFQRQVSDLRRQAFRNQTPLTLVSTAVPKRTDEHQAAQASEDQPKAVRLTLRQDWTYALAEPLAISVGGGCSNASVQLIHAEKTRVRLVSKDGSCHFVRVGA